MKDTGLEVGAETEQKGPNIEAFDLEYIPKKILYRDKQLSELREFITVAKKFGVKQHIQIYGPTGTGKTLSIKYLYEVGVLDEKEDIYVEAHSTPLYTIIKIAEAAKVKIPKRGYSIDALTVMMLDEISRAGYKTVIIDDIHKIQKGLDEIMFHLCEKVNVIVIGNKPITDYLSDDATKARFRKVSLYYPPYTYDEILGILSNRVKESNIDIPDWIVEKVASTTATIREEMRYALTILQRVAIKILLGTEVTYNVLSDIVSTVESDAILKAIETFSPHQLVALYLIANRYIEDTKELYIAVMEITEPKFGSVSFRHMRRLLAEMADVGLIYYETYGLGRGKGKKTIVRLSEGGAGSARLDPLKISHKVEELLRSYNVSLNGVREVIAKVKKSKSLADLDEF